MKILLCAGTVAASRAKLGELAPGDLNRVLFAPGGTSIRSVDGPAKPSGCRLLVPNPSGATVIVVIAELGCNL
jgi:hypothetical protein